MAYTKQTWTDGSAGGTPVSAARLNKMETGVGDAHDLVAAETTRATDAEATKVNSSTYTAGLATKADTTALAAKADVLTLADTVPQFYDFVASLSKTNVVDTSKSSRTVIDASVTASSPNLTSATAAFSAADVGGSVSGAGVVRGTTIVSVTSATVAVMSQNGSSAVNNGNMTFGKARVQVTLPDAPVGSTVKVLKINSAPMPVNVVTASGTLAGSTTIRAQHATRTYLRDTATTWRAVDGLTPLAAPGASLLAHAVTRQRGCIVSITGDSCAPLGPAQPGRYAGLHGNGAGNPDDWSAWLSLISGGRVQIGAVDGLPTTDAEQITSRFPRLLESSPAHFVVCDASYINSSSNTTVTAFIGYLKQQCDMAQAAGAMPVVHTGYPTLLRKNVTDGYRQAVISAASQYGWIVADTWTPLTDPATGFYKTGLNDDNIHPNRLGKKVVAQAIYDAIKPYLLPNSPVVQTTNVAADTGSLLANGLFLTDTNADGLPDNFTRNGTGGTISIVSGDAEIIGNALRLQDTASGGTFSAQQNVTTPTTYAGKRIALSGRVRVDSTAGGVALYSYMRSASGLQANHVYLKPMTSWNLSTDGWRNFRIEANAPADLDAIQTKFECFGGTAVDARIAQMRLDVVS